MKNKAVEVLKEKEKEKLSKEYIRKIQQIDDLTPLITLCNSLAEIWRSEGGDADTWIWPGLNNSAPLGIILNKEQSIEKDFNCFLERYLPLIKETTGTDEYSTLEESDQVKYIFHGNKWRWFIYVMFEGSMCQRVRVGEKHVVESVYEIKCKEVA